ncbi:MAG: hypothetical protein OSB05_14365 [Akkermansiaceae bacterium]|nr:hypothetical protein [Akkermansiaceae bacterium]
MKEPWSIKSRARECAATETKFEAGQKIRAAIFPDPDSSGYLRKDFTLEAWNHREDEGSPFSTWITTFEPPIAEEKAEDVVDQNPESLLRKMIEDDEEHTENARYILAVMLERQKLLRETDTQEISSGILRVYEHRKTGDVFIIKDPQIPLSDVDRIQEEVKQLLDPEPEPELESQGEQATLPESADAPPTVTKDSLKEQIADVPEATTDEEE